MSEAEGPTQEELAAFASQALEVLRAAGADDEVTYEADDGVIQINDDIALDIGQLYQHYMSQPDELRPKILENLGSYFQDLKDGDLSENWDEVADKVVPVLKARFAYEHLVLDHRLNDRNPPQLPRKELGESGYLGVGYLRRQSIAVIEERHVEAWGVTNEELYDRAVANLRAKAESPFTEQSPGVWAAMVMDGLDAGRIVLTEEIAALPVQGDPVAYAPHDRLLIIVGSEDAKAIAQLAQGGAQQLNDPRSLNLRPLVLEDGEWDDFEVDDDHPAAQTLGLLIRAAEARAYRQQGLLLDQIYKKEEEPTICGAYQLLQDNREDGKPGLIYGLATWAEGVDMLLPRADRVIFAKPIGGEKYNVLGQAPWFDVVRVLGDRMELVENQFPKRFRVKSFPTVDELNELQLKRWTPPQQKPQQPPPGASAGGTMTAP